MRGQSGVVRLEREGFSSNTEVARLGWLKISREFSEKVQLDVVLRKPEGATLATV